MVAARVRRRVVRHTHRRLGQPRAAAQNTQTSMISKILKQDRMLAPRIILALTTGMMLTCSAKVSFGQSPEPVIERQPAAVTISR